MIKLIWDKKNIYAIEPADVTALQNGFYGRQETEKRVLSIEEALYLMDIRNGRCFDEAGNEYKFNDIAERYLKRKKLLARYLTYKDWRDKGLPHLQGLERQGVNSPLCRRSKRRVRKKHNEKIQKRRIKDR